MFYKVVLPSNGFRSCCNSSFARRCSFSSFVRSATLSSSLRSRALVFFSSFSALVARAFSVWACCLYFATLNCEKYVKWCTKRIICLDHQNLLLFQLVKAEAFRWWNIVRVCHCSLFEGCWERNRPRVSVTRPFLCTLKLTSSKWAEHTWQCFAGAQLSSCLMAFTISVHCCLSFVSLGNLKICNHL